jgi:hypothetical protein
MKREKSRLMFQLEEIPWKILIIKIEEMQLSSEVKTGINFSLLLPLK